MAKKNYYIEGVPISSKWKVTTMLILFLVLLLNTVLPRYFTQFDYGFNGIVSIILVTLIVLVSIGSKTAETIIIAITIFAISSNLWDFFVRDFSYLRNQILIGSILVLVVTLALGKIGILNLIRVLRGQGGVK
ncbi:MAG: hypothetical protein KKF56_05700 [Nanoarchaeota archaeon]|nr:hypothetical protein [Nanoarchaeota archaeon]